LNEIKSDKIASLEYMACYKSMVWKLTFDVSNCALKSFVFGTRIPKLGPRYEFKSGGATLYTR